MSDDPCRNTVELNAFQEKQDQHEMEQRIIEKQITELVEDKVVDISNDDVKTGLDFCENEWAEFMRMNDIEVDYASVHEVIELAKLAQTLKTKLLEEMRDVVKAEAKREYYKCPF